MVTKDSLLKMAGEHAARFVVPSILKSFGYGLLAGILSLGFAIIVAASGVGWVLGLILVVTFTFAGGVAGLLIGATSAMRQGIKSAEREASVLLEPIMGAIISNMPGNNSGISAEQFMRIVDERIAALQTAGDESSSRIAGLTSFLARRVSEQVLSATKFVLRQDLASRLSGSADGMITVQAVEKFARDRMLGLVTGYFYLKLAVLRRVAFAVLITMVLLGVVIVAL